MGMNQRLPSHRFFFKGVLKVSKVSPSFFDSFKGSKMTTNFFDLFKVSNITANLFDLFKVGKMITISLICLKLANGYYFFDLFKFSKMTTDCF